MSGSNSSQLLPLFVGGIKFPEENTKIQVNCLKEGESSSSEGRSGLEKVEIEQLWPE